MKICHKHISQKREKELKQQVLDQKAPELSETGDEKEEKSFPQSNYGENIETS